MRCEVAFRTTIQRRLETQGIASDRALTFAAWASDLDLRLVCTGQRGTLGSLSDEQWHAWCNLYWEYEPRIREVRVAEFAQEFESNADDFGAERWRLELERTRAMRKRLTFLPDALWKVIATDDSPAESGE